VKQTEIARLETLMAATGFWDNTQEAQKTIGLANQLKNAIAPAVQFQKKVDDLSALVDLMQEMDDKDPAGTEFLEELEKTLRTLFAEIDKIELQCFLSGPHDNASAIINIHAGAGGTESCDWADMLFRMYTRWAERSGYSLDVQDVQSGEEAGISSATFRISGPYAYGYAKAERGVHRLVRISPFDSNKRRHTSFASVDVVAEIDDDVEIEIKDDDIRVDVYRSSGKGGQHVNRTESAVRITHLPTNIVVTCQNERSQIKNRATAMKTLKARLYQKLEDEKRAEQERFYGEKGEIAWGNQIRSYVFQPYQMVKDLRTSHETSNVQAVMDGDIQPFVDAWLRAGCSKTQLK